MSLLLHFHIVKADRDSMSNATNTPLGRSLHLPSLQRLPSNEVVKKFHSLWLLTNLCFAILNNNSCFESDMCVRVCGLCACTSK